MAQRLADRYQIKRELAAGGFGTTYLARDMMRPRHPLCVVKQLLQFNEPDELQIAKRLFEQEAQILEDLGKYPQIPQLLAHFTEAGRFYLVQEYIPGHQLSEEIEPGNPWSEGQVIQLLQDILTPLTVLHEHHVIHRDIKPDNLIRRGEDDKLVLIDFGAVKQQLSQLTQLGGKTQLTVSIGTPGYMPSEQALGKPKLCSDIYAVGTIAIEALTGKSSHKLASDDNLELIWQPFAPRASPELRAILEKMVRYHFSDRYPSARDALAEVKKLPTPPAPTTSRGQQKYPQPKATLIQAPPTALTQFRFQVVTANKKGEIVRQEEKSARSFPEHLGAGITLEMVEIPEGEFRMGSPEDELGRTEDEGPQHSVTVPSFFMGKFAVTQSQWRKVASFPQVNRFLKLSPSHFEGDNLPVEQVSREDCAEFCDRLSRYTGKTYSLPSEAQWEYACRAGTTTPFHFGATLTPELANYYGKSSYADGPEGTCRQKTTPVGSFSPNGFGLYDMHGNVWEWCADYWHETYLGAPVDGRIWESGDEDHKCLIRGGSWYHFPNDCRSANRYWVVAEYWYRFYGFRVVCSRSSVP
ncbi:bifunctional serine/threonine-protein kinase/formylglycine-generating enzyme family protein [Roseofilum casamattae]|uniref:Bifunctional serine/threonine-protein kinase/formylglycine-generating enzyme family protein n=1 Tax=Roseofilum casamattae BLCC-M143 TaxID=3022442 RepID=A0ABT7BTU4_9CYAN|nr:bifunctional serine/threonine-protein kinase/formylglycine-generating enzyme family protein [Roseofilum casamattae]MDJ1182613.1 bifunctional serine/threonine-protein kinase/formylglycine-generating enzyme family protein [Roseofilum casamattae BLCC-M143]